MKRFFVSVSLLVALLVSMSSSALANVAWDRNGDNFPGSLELPIESCEFPAESIENP